MIPAIVAAALIAAITSLIVSTVVAFRFERVKRFVALEDDDTRKTLDFMGRSIELLQEFRDKLAMVADAPEESLSPETAIAMLVESRDAFTHLYRSGLPVAPTPIAQRAHGIKNLLIRATADVSEQLAGHAQKEGLLRSIEHHRQVIRECQIMLVDMRLDVRVRGLSPSHGS